MVNIDQFKKFVEYVSNKNQSGSTITPAQFNIVAQRAQMQKFETDYQNFKQTEEITDFLVTFLKNIKVSVDSYGELDYPTDFEHISSIRKYYVSPRGEGNWVPVADVNNIAWGLANISSLLKPNARFPKYSEFSNKIRFLPYNIGLVEMDYFKTPVAPVWGYTVVNNRPVYSPAASTNFEFSDFAFDNVAAIYLSLIGVNLKDSQLAQFAEMYKQQTNSIE